MNILPSMLIPIANLPPFTEDMGYGRCTHDVLVTDGHEWWIAYYQKLDDFDGEWKIKGRDGYTLEKKLIGWQYLPKLP